MSFHFGCTDTYHAGEPVEGQLQMKLEEGISKFQGVQLIFEGKELTRAFASTHQKEGVHLQTKDQFTQEPITRQEVTLFPDFEAFSAVPAGSYSIPFLFNTDESFLPSFTFENRAIVKYTLTVKLKKDASIEENNPNAILLKDHVHTITILSPIKIMEESLNLLNEPQNISGSKPFRVSRSHGELTANVTLGSSFGFYDDRVSVDIHVQNDSSKKVASISLFLHQRVDIQADGDNDFNDTPVFVKELKFKDPIPGQTSRDISMEMIIPSGICAPFDGTNMRVTYRVEVILHPRVVLGHKLSVIYENFMIIPGKRN